MASMLCTGGLRYLAVVWETVDEGPALLRNEPEDLMMCLFFCEMTVPLDVFNKGATHSTSSREIFIKVSVDSRYCDDGVSTLQYLFASILLNVINQEVERDGTLELTPFERTVILRRLRLKR